MFAPRFRKSWSIFRNVIGNVVLIFFLRRCIMYHIRSSFLKLAFMASMLLWASIAVTPATAAPVTIHFGGQVLFSNGSSIPPQSLSGNYIYENTTPDSNGTPTTGRYNHDIANPDPTGVTGLTVNIGSYTATLGNSGSNFIQIQQATILDNVDRYVVRAPLVGPLVGEFSPLSFRIEFIHAPGSFGSAALPATLGSLFTSSISNNFRAVFENGDNPTTTLSGSLNHVTTPLPPAVILFGAGLVSLIGLGARNRWLKGNSIA